MLHIPQSFSITGTSPSDCLVSYLGHSLLGGGSYPSAEVQSVYSTAPTDWATRFDEYRNNMNLISMHNNKKCFKYKKEFELISENFFCDLLFLTNRSSPFSRTSSIQKKKGSKIVGFNIYAVKNILFFLSVSIFCCLARNDIITWSQVTANDFRVQPCIIYKIGSLPFFTYGPICFLFNADKLQ